MRPCLRRRGPELSGERKRASCSRLALNHDLALHQRDQPRYDCQSEPAAAVFARGGRVGLTERMKQQVALVGWNSDTGVGHREFEAACGCRVRVAYDGN